MLRAQKHRGDYRIGRYAARKRPDGWWSLGILLDNDEPSLGFVYGTVTVHTRLRDAVAHANRHSA